MECSPWYLIRGLCKGKEITCLTTGPRAAVENARLREGREERMAIVSNIPCLYHVNSNRGVRFCSPRAPPHLPFFCVYFLPPFSYSQYSFRRQTRISQTSFGCACAGFLIQEVVTKQLSVLSEEKLPQCGCCTTPLSQSDNFGWAASKKPHSTHPPIISYV